MSSDPSNRVPPLTLISEHGTDSGQRKLHGAGNARSAARDVDWSVLMACAQAGDGTAYRRLLEEVTPYLRSLAARCHRNPGDVEDAIQDVLLTVHAIRHTYDPARPFGPWLVTIANRRLVDRLRRQGRMRSHETPLEAEHETFPAARANENEVMPDVRKLEAAIATLPPGQRQAIRLLKLKEMSLKEAAAASGASVASLKVATHRALKNLRKMLSGGSGKS
ncbi:MAG: sigma-70 family RNA polymerase sigma factor [Steroidobacteraceae bacterium]